MRLRTTALASSALITALLLAGCAQNTGTGGMPGMNSGSNPMSPPAGTADFNSADEMFLMMMIPHHEQAIEMADLLLGKDGDDMRVTDLAQKIKDAQGPEIETMKSWLAEWGMPYNDSMSGGIGGMDHGGGMMSEEDMAALESASGTDAVRLFLEGMIEHHQGAIVMAQTELDNGQNADTLALAQTIIDAQTAEITTMQGILGTL